MEKKRKRFYFIPVIILAVILLLSGVVMALWNAILPGIIGVKTITYGQAIGLLVLSRILFGSFRPGPPGGFRRGGPPWRSKLMNLTPEEKENFKKEWKKRFFDKDQAG